MNTEARDDAKRKGPKGSVRTCAGCGKRDAADAFVRVVLGPPDDRDGAHVVAVDANGGAFGRGASVHPTHECVDKACRGGFAKAFKQKIADVRKTIGNDIVTANNRRIHGLIGGAKRARQLAIGADAVKEALREGAVALVIVAADAAAAADSQEVRGAIDVGKAVVLGTKATLGPIVGRDEVAVFAVQNAGVADAVVRAHRMSQPFRSEAWWSPEVR